MLWRAPQAWEGERERYDCLRQPSSPASHSLFEPATNRSVRATRQHGSARHHPSVRRGPLGWCLRRLRSNPMRGTRIQLQIIQPQPFNGHDQRCMDTVHLDDCKAVRTRTAVAEIQDASAHRQFRAGVPQHLRGIGTQHVADGECGQGTNSVGCTHTRFLSKSNLNPSKRLADCVPNYRLCHGILKTSLAMALSTKNAGATWSWPQSPGNGLSTRMHNACTEPVSPLPWHRGQRNMSSDCRQIAAKTAEVIGVQHARPRAIQIVHLKTHVCTLLHTLKTPEARLRRCPPKGRLWRYRETSSGREGRFSACGPGR